MEVNHRTAKSLVGRLAAAATDKTIVSSLADIRILSKKEPESRSLLADAGLVPLLLYHLLHSPEARIQENASAALLNLSITVPEPVMSTPSLLSSLVHSMKPGSPDAVAQNAAATVYSLLSVDAYRPIFGSKNLIITSLLSLLKHRSMRTVKDSLKALFAMSLYTLNRQTLVQLGAIPALFYLVTRYGRTGIVKDATAVVAQVAGCYESVAAFREVAGVRVLVGVVVEGGSERARENAVSALLNLVTSGGERAVGDISEVEGSEAAVREIAEKGSTRGKAKGEALLRILDSGRGCGNCWRAESAEFLDSPPGMSPASSASGDANSF